MRASTVARRPASNNPWAAGRTAFHSDWIVMQISRDAIHDLHRMSCSSEARD